jgi:hypothetical protein
MQYLTALAIAVATATSVTARQVTVENNCPFTIWYGLLPLRLAFILNSDNFPLTGQLSTPTSMQAEASLASRPAGSKTLSRAFPSVSLTTGRPVVSGYDPVGWPGRSTR